MLTLSKTDGIGGTIKNRPEDFVVEEITATGAVLEQGTVYGPERLGMEPKDGDFAVFVMQKRDWNTVQALKAVAGSVKRGIRSVGFAGTKDRTSVSTQLCSVFGAKPEQLLEVKLKDISINGAWASDRGIGMGDLLGNRFTVTVADAERPENIDRINRELDGVFPNYFGEQRFGVRENNVEIGLALLKGDLEEAVMLFLTDYVKEKNEDAIAARRRLAEERDFGKALEYFPKYLKYERPLLAVLAELPTDYAGAFKRLPRQLALMFVHSVESHIFNKEVETRVQKGLTDPQEYDDVCIADSHGFPDPNITYLLQEESGRKRFPIGNLVGYNTEPNEIEISIMEELGIKKEDFRIKRMPELSCKGSKRLLFAPYVGFSCTTDPVKMRFSLPSGSYATVLLQEFMKIKE